MHGGQQFERALHRTPVREIRGAVRGGRLRGRSPIGGPARQRQQLPEALDAGLVDREGPCQHAKVQRFEQAAVFGFDERSGQTVERREPPAQVCKRRARARPVVEERVVEIEEDRGDGHARFGHQLLRCRSVHGCAAARAATASAAVSMSPREMPR